MEVISPQLFKTFLLELTRTTKKTVRAITNTDLLTFFSRRYCAKCDRYFINALELAKHQVQAHTNFDPIDLDPDLLISDSLFIHPGSPGLRN